MYRSVGHIYKVDEKAMIRKRYYRFPHPAQDTKPEREWNQVLNSANGKTKNGN